MKKFLTIDYYVQSLVLVLTVLVLLILLLDKQSGVQFYFYFIVGPLQFVSFCIRSSLSFKKSTIFKIYGWLIVPIWVILFFSILLQGASIDLGVLNTFAGVFLGYLVLSLFFSPILALVYLFDCYLTFKSYEKSTL